MTSPEGPEDTERRIAALERAVALLTEEITTLRAELRHRAASAPVASAPVASASAPHAAGDAFSRVAPGVAPGRAHPHGATARPTRQPSMPPVARAAPAAWRRIRDENIDVEALVGRYGTMVLGALTILLGVGAFLRWAVQRVTIGPEMRVGLGALATAAVAALGFWLRERDAGGAGTRRFGNVLLALSLALLQVVAWGAGPALGVVPSGVALVVAAAASVALAVLAWRAGEQALFVVGVGGALLAPFVTSSEAGSPLLLLGYGLLVVVAALVAQQGRDWPWARRVLGIGVLAYVGAALGASERTWPGGGTTWLRTTAPAVFVLACAATALRVGGSAARSALARQWLVVLAIPLFGGATFGLTRAYELHLVALALAGTVMVYVALRLTDARQPLATASAIAQPPLLLLAALAALPSGWNPPSAAATALWAAVAFAAAYDAGAGVFLSRVGEAPDDAPPAAPPVTPSIAPSAAPRAMLPPWIAHLLVGGMLVVAAVVIATDDARLVGASVLAATGVGAALLASRAAAPVLLLTPLTALVVAASWVIDRLDARVAYEYVPFASAASLAAAVVVAGWWVAGRLVARGVTGPDIGRTERRLLAAAGPVAAFAWGYGELSRAFSPDLADFLVILYLATAGVLCIALGRRWRVPGGRRVGLALAVWAALKALVEASDFDSVGLRVGAYLLVGVFLLGVAYWYRAAGEEGASRFDGREPVGEG